MKFKAHSRQQKSRTLEGEKLVFQKNRYKIQTYINPFEKNNDHMWITRKMQFCSSFKEFYS